MKKLSLIILVLSSLAANSAQPDLLPGNFWPNPDFEQGENLDSTGGTPTGWLRGGSGPDICQVALAGPAPNHALAVIDADNRYGEWYSDLSLVGHVSAGDKIDLQWFELYDIAGSEMRVTIQLLTASGGAVDVKHFVARGTSDGYAGDLTSSTFTKRNETIDVPEGAATLRFSLVSGGTLETIGFMVIDDVSAARHPAPILLAGNIWTNTPTFEEGIDLDLATGTPDNWNRGGADPNLLQMTSDASISPTHALAVFDTNASYGEWYSDLPIAGLVRAGDTLNLQWFEMYNVSAGGEMRVTVLMLDSANAVVEAKHYVTSGQSPGWAGSVAASSFTKRNESVVVPEGAATLRVSLVSGGPPETTGVMVIDDVSANKASPPLPEVLVGNVWPNPGFEEGDNLADPANATVMNWQRSGNDPSIDLLSSGNSVSPTHALAVVDNNADGYGEWYADLQLGAATAPGKSLDFQWFELFSVTNGEMRLTLVFYDATNQVVGESHFVAQGSSSGWNGTVVNSTFTRRNEKLAVPTGANRIRAYLVSGGPAATLGLMLIDNLSIAPETNSPVALFGSFWSNPGFEEGTDLDTPNVGQPAGWSRGGNDVSIDQVITDAFMSSTHALAVIDNKTDTFGEWYQFVDLAGKAAPGDPLEVQWWEMFSITNGEMRVSIHFMNGDTEVEAKHFVATTNSSGWNENIARSFFTRRNESLTVPANANRLLVTLTSGGPAETTGVMVIDDFSIAKPPPPPDLLAGNVWPNPTFEEGTQLEKPTLGLPDGGWRRGGNNIPGDQVTTLRATSPTHALAVVDTNENAYSEWYVQVPIEGLFVPGDTVELQWYELYDTLGTMRVSFYFRAQDETVIDQRHFQISGQPPSWTGDLATSPFEKRNEQIQVPENAVFLMMTLTSGGSEASTGTYIIDDFSMRPVRNEFRITSFSSVATGWQLSWESKPGKSYTVESAATLGQGGFSPVPGLESVSASDGTETGAIDTRANLGAAQYYRVIELP